MRYFPPLLIGKRRLEVITTSEHRCVIKNRNESENNDPCKPCEEYELFYHYQNNCYDSKCFNLCYGVLGNYAYFHLQILYEHFLDDFF